MAKKTEKQIEAKRLYDQEILTVAMSDCKFGKYKSGNWAEEAKFKMCIINGQRWVQIDQYYSSRWTDSLQENGSLKAGDVLHAKTMTDVSWHGSKKQRLQLHTLFRMEALLPHRDYIIEAVGRDWRDIEGEFILLFDKGMTIDIEEEHVIDEESMRKSEAAYRRRLQLIAENAEDKRRKEAGMDNNDEQAPADEQQPEEQPTDSEQEEPSEETVKELEVARVLCKIFEKNDMLARRVEVQENIIKSQEGMIECYKQMMVNYDRILAERDTAIAKLKSCLGED